MHEVERTAEATPLVPDLVRSTTFVANSAETHAQLYAEGSPSFYQRFGNPTIRQVERRLAELEGAEASLLFSSGMGAISTTMLALLRPGLRVLAHVEIFAQTEQLLHEWFRDFGVSTTFVDMTTVDVGAVAKDVQPGLIYIETPSNPLLDVVSIGAAAAAAHATGALLIVDGTFAPPVLQLPLQLGADLVVHSGTKYLNGHSDAMCGVVSGGADLVARIEWVRRLMGNVPDPQAAWLLNRGLHTLELRVRRQSESAARIADHLVTSADVEDVRYPFHPLSSARARPQMTAGGAMVSFVLAGGIARARRFLNRLRRIPIATSLGGVESVIELAYDLDFMEGQRAAESPRRHVPALIRLSVGIEPVEALLEDIEQALEATRGEA